MLFSIAFMTGAGAGAGELLVSGGGLLDSSADWLRSSIGLQHKHIHFFCFDTHNPKQTFDN